VSNAKHGSNFIHNINRGMWECDKGCKMNKGDEERKGRITN
jgi:hypothetical protein